MGSPDRSVLEEDFCGDWQFGCRECRDKETKESEMLKVEAGKVAWGQSRVQQ